MEEMLDCVSEPLSWGVSGWGVPPRQRGVGADILFLPVLKNWLYSIWSSVVIFIIPLLPSLLVSPPHFASEVGTHIYKDEFELCIWDSIPPPCPKYRNYRW